MIFIFFFTEKGETKEMHDNLNKATPAQKYKHINVSKLIEPLFKQIDETQK